MVLEGPLLQYGSFIHTCKPNPELTLMLNAIHTWSSYARVHNAHLDEFMSTNWLPCLLVFSSRMRKWPKNATYIELSCTLISDLCVWVSILSTLPYVKLILAAFDVYSTLMMTNYKDSSRQYMRI